MHVFGIAIVLAVGIILIQWIEQRFRLCLGGDGQVLESGFHFPTVAIRRHDGVPLARMAFAVIDKDLKSIGATNEAIEWCARAYCGASKHTLTFEQTLCYYFRQG